MKRQTIYTLVILGVLVYLIGSGYSQVTFSKGWGPGKRTSYDDRVNRKFKTQPLVSAYDMFVAELRKFLTNENRRAMPYSKSDDGSEIDVNGLMVER